MCTTAVDVWYTLTAAIFNLQLRDMIPCYDMSVMYHIGIVYSGFLFAYEVLIYHCDSFTTAVLHNVAILAYSLIAPVLSLVMRHP